MSVVLSGSETISGSVIQKSLPAPSCRDASHTCEPPEGPGKHPSKFLSSALDVFLLHGLWVCPL